MKKKSPTIFAYPVAKICGKISRHSKVVHACTASGQQITYLQGARDLEAHPVTQAELARQELFKRRQFAAAARISKKSATYVDDMTAYRNQLKDANHIKGFRAYIWSLVKAEIPE